MYFIFTKHTFIAKGILCVEDALGAAEARVDGIAVSNHRGRFLGFTPGIAEVFLEIANAVRSPPKGKGKFAEILVPGVIEGFFARINLNTDGKKFQISIHNYRIDMLE